MNDKFIIVWMYNVWFCQEMLWLNVTRHKIFKIDEIAFLFR